MRKTMKVLLIIFCLGAAVGIMLLSAVCICAAKTRIPAKSDCIVVLGARVWPDGRMSNSLLYRCEAALDAWEKGVAPEIIVCGGMGDNEPVTEASAMKAWLVEQGVPEPVIHAEDTSTDTRENLRNAKSIMQSRGFHSAALCTSDYHLTRALWLAKDADIPATGISARSPSTLRSFIFGRCRETVSWVLYFLKII